MPYCQQAPRNKELNGLFQCQFQGADPVNFTGGDKAGAPGTIPFGQTTILNPAGSCPAHTSGPIADGTQLVDQVSSPGVPSGSGSGKIASPEKSPSSPTDPMTTPTSSSSPAPANTPPSSNSKGFAVQNGQDAQALNEKFKTLTADSSCTGNYNFPKTTCFRTTTDFATPRM